MFAERTGLVDKLSGSAGIFGSCPGSHKETKKKSRRREKTKGGCLLLYL